MQEVGVIAAVYAHTSARIGDANDGWRNGIITRCNALAQAAGIASNQTVHLCSETHKTCLPSSSTTWCTPPAWWLIISVVKRSFSSSPRAAAASSSVPSRLSATRSVRELDRIAALLGRRVTDLRDLQVKQAFQRQMHFHLPGTDAYAGYLMAAAGFLALAHTLKRGEHIRVTLLLSHLRLSYPCHRCCLLGGVDLPKMCGLRRL